MAKSEKKSKKICKCGKFYLPLQQKQTNNNDYGKLFPIQI